MKPWPEISATAFALVSGASTTLLIRVIGAGLAFLTQVLLARLLGVEEYGIYAFAMVWILVGGQIGSFGFGEAATKFLAQYRADGELKLARGFRSISLIFVLSANVLIASIVLLIVFLKSDWIESPYLVPICIAAITIPVMACQDLLEGKGLAFSWTLISLAPGYIGRQGLNLTFIIFLLLSGYNMTADLALLAMFAASLTSLTLQYTIISKRLKTKLGSGAKDYLWKNWKKTVAPIAAREAIYVVGRNIDVFLIGIFLSAQNMALYFAATRLTGILSLFHFSFTTAALSRFATNTITRNERGLIELANSSSVLIFAATGVAYFLLVVAGFPLLELFGEGFSDGYWLLLILGFGTLAYSSVGAAEDILIMHDLASKTMITQIVAVVTTLLLSLLLLPDLGSIGAAISMTTGLLVMTFMLEFYVRRHVGISTFVLTLKNVMPNT